MGIKLFAETYSAFLNWRLLYHQHKTLQIVQEISVLAPSLVLMPDLPLPTLVFVCFCLDQESHFLDLGIWAWFISNSTFTVYPVFGTLYPVHNIHGLCQSGFAISTSAARAQLVSKPIMKTKIRSLSPFFKFLLLHLSFVLLSSILFSSSPSIPLAPPSLSAGLHPLKPWQSPVWLYDKAWKLITHFLMDCAYFQAFWIPRLT